MIGRIALLLNFDEAQNGNAYLGAVSASGTGAYVIKPHEIAMRDWNISSDQARL